MCCISLRLNIAWTSSAFLWQLPLIHGNVALFINDDENGGGGLYRMGDFLSQMTEF